MQLSRSFPWTYPPTLSASYVGTTGVTTPPLHLFLLLPVVPYALVLGSGWSWLIFRGRKGTATHLFVSRWVRLGTTGYSYWPLLLRISCSISYFFPSFLFEINKYVWRILYWPKVWFHGQFDRLIVPLSWKSTQSSSHVKILPLLGRQALKIDFACIVFPFFLQRQLHGMYIHFPFGIHRFDFALDIVSVCQYNFF